MSTVPSCFPEGESLSSLRWADVSCAVLIVEDVLTFSHRFSSSGSSLMSTVPSCVKEAESLSSLRWEDVSCAVLIVEDVLTCVAFS